MLLTFGSVEPQAKSIKNRSFGEENIRSKVSDFKHIYERTYFSKNHFNQEPDGKLRKTFLSNPEWRVHLRRVHRVDQDQVWARCGNSHQFSKPVAGKHKKTCWNTSFNNACQKSNFY